MILAGENCANFPKKSQCLDQKCFSGTNHQIPIWDHFGLLHPFNLVFLLCINDRPVSCNFLGVSSRFPIDWVNPVNHGQPWLDTNYYFNLLSMVKFIIVYQLNKSFFFF